MTRWFPHADLPYERAVPAAGRPDTITLRPREKNPRRPVASHQRFVKTLEKADAVDAEGRLRCVLQLVRYTGRRETAVLKLTADDVLLSVERVRERLATLGHDERLADHYVHGAIHWVRDVDKDGRERVTPLSREARAAVDAYLRRRPTLGAALLFAAPYAPGKPLGKPTAWAWLRKAERRAGLPKLAGGAYHPYRRLWASERAGLPDAAVAEAGGWKDERVMKASYQRVSGDVVLAAVEAHRMA